MKTSICSILIRTFVTLLFAGLMSVQVRAQTTGTIGMMEPILMDHTGNTLVIKDWWAYIGSMGEYSSINYEEVTPMGFDPIQFFLTGMAESASTIADVDVYSKDGDLLTYYYDRAAPTYYGNGLLPVGTRLLMGPPLGEVVEYYGYYFRMYGYTVLMDTDGDGINDHLDECANSDLRPTVVINEGDTGVTNDLLSSGCTLSDLIHHAIEEAGGTSSYVREMVEVLIELKRDGAITGQEMGTILRSLTQP